jgi:hypothetical protein
VDVVHRGGEVIISDGGDDGSDGGPVAYDGTTGRMCTTDAQCAGPGGPGINQCSTSLVSVLAGVTIAPLPTPICMVPPGPNGYNCDPAPASDPTGMYIHGCDGPDGSASTPGICVSFSTPPVTGQGYCLPACTFLFDGSAPTGCVGNDTCTPIAGAGYSDATGNIVGGVGYCQGTCEKDSDCSGLGTGWVCQTEIGQCTQHKKTFTKALGSACNAGTTACNCLTNINTNLGFCTSSCIVGGTVPCPNGWQCDNLQAPNGPNGTPIPENAMTPGVCLPACSLPGDGGTSPEASTGVDAATGSDAATDASPAPADAAPEGSTVLTTCLPNSMCQIETGQGAECLP